MLYTGNPYVITPGNVFFMHMILMDSDSKLAMNLGETYLVIKNGNERLGKQKTGFSGLIGHNPHVSNNKLNYNYYYKYRGPGGNQT